jgi:DNA-binding XRE family transcriptional regulator
MSIDQRDPELTELTVLSPSAMRQVRGLLSRRDGQPDRREVGMAQALKPLEPGRSAPHRFGAELRRWRQARGLSQAALARLVHVSPDLIGKVEKADRRPTRDLLDGLDRVLGTAGALAELWPEVEREGVRRAAPASQNGMVFPVDPELVGHWSRMLVVLAATDNAVGVRGLREVVVGELRLLSGHRRAASGPLQRRLATVEARWLEFASWVADNDGDPAGATAWLQQAHDMAGENGDEVLCGYVLMRRAQRAVEAGDAATAIALLDAGPPTARLPPRIRALSMVRVAQAHALAGDDAAARTALNAAYRYVDRAGGDTEDEVLAAHCGSAYIAAHEAQCRLMLGDSASAVAGYRRVLAAWPAGQRLDEGLFRAQLAIAYDQAGMADEAEAEGLRAVDLARQTGSHRTLRTLAGRRARMLPRGGPHSQFHRAWLTVAATEQAS